MIAELDADAHRDVAKDYDVHGFPTLKVISLLILLYSSSRRERLFLIRVIVPLRALLSS